ncbi:MAG: right-handed parallel beta-helix repeat-containing protein [Elusimicrobiota bacterium]
MRSILWSALFSVLVVSGRPCRAATYYVAPTGNNANAGTSESAPLLTIGHCVSKAIHPGDTCLVKNGTYAENTILLRYSGAPGNPITIANYPGHSPVIRPADGNAINAVYMSAGRLQTIGWIVFRGFTITNARYAGFKYANAHDTVIQSNYIHHNKSQGILGHGLRMTIDRNTITRCGNWERCVVVSTSCNQVHGMYMTGSSYTVTNNLIYENLAFGIQVAAYPYDCTQYYGGQYCGSWNYAAPEYAGVNHWLIANNTLAYNVERAGIVLWMATKNVRVENNIFYENCVRCGSGSSQGINLTSASSGISFKNNVAYASGSGGLGFLDSRAVEGVDYTQSGNITTTNPAFVNGGNNALPASPDFRLTAQSPAINRGLNLYASGVRTDLIGVARPQTGPFEIGAYEYGGTTPPPPAFDFALANGGNKSVTRGGSVTNSLTASLVSGTAQAVSFSVTGLPSGVTGGFSPASCTPNCSSTLTLSASASAALGTASLTVTAAGGGITKTSAFTLTVNAPQTSTHSVTLSAAQAAPGAAFIATVNGGSGSATQWVAVYLATAPDSAYSYKGNWKYLNGTQTAPATAVPTPVQLTFAAPMDAGVYNLRFFANTGTGTRLALSPNLTVSSTTDLNGDGITNVADVQLAVNQASGAATCGSGDVNKDGACNVADVQLVVNRSLGL